MSQEEIADAAIGRSSLTENEIAERMRLSLSYTKKMEFKYEDFLKRSHPSRFPTVRNTNLNWDDHAYPIISQLYHEEVGFLDRFFLFPLLHFSHVLYS